MKRFFLAMVITASLAFPQHPETAQDHGPSPVWKWANFAILAGLIGFGIAKGAGPFFRDRTARIRKAIQEAKAIQADAQERAAEMDRRMATLEFEITALKVHSSREMAAEGARMQAETAKLNARMQENARNEIAAAANQATKELRAYSGELALELARQKIRERLNPELQGSLVDAFVSMLPRPRGPVN